MKRTIELNFITPMFSHGATDTPEIRPSSIRGQLHSWFRLLGGDIISERRIFGGIKQNRANFQGHNETLASKIVVRIDKIDGVIKDYSILPHKLRSPIRKAFAPETTCIITIFDRLGGLSLEDWGKLNRAINGWLLMGTLGFRSTRAGGSFTWKDDKLPMPNKIDEYSKACQELLSHTNNRCAILSTAYNTANDARKVVSDSLGGRNNDPQFGGDSLKGMNYPLGRIQNGRKTSPLKYRIIKVENYFHILAFWDGRTDVTNNNDRDFFDVINLLADRKPEIGSQLKKAFTK